LPRSHRLSEEDAVRRIIGAIVARFDGDSLLAIASELIRRVQAHPAVWQQRRMTTTDNQDSRN
jgi:hypothetical protein